MSDSQHVIPVRTYLVVYFLLMLLLVATVGASFLDLGHAHLAVALTIALIKAVMIVLIFMHVYYSAKLTWVVAGATSLWIALFMAFLFADYFGRGWLLSGR
jgi:cytochrome c oxidase subunit IV